MVFVSVEKPICTPLHLSNVSLALPLKQFQCLIYDGHFSGLFHSKIGTMRLKTFTSCFCHWIAVHQLSNWKYWSYCTHPVCILILHTKARLDSILKFMNAFNFGNGTLSYEYSPGKFVLTSWFDFALGVSWTGMTVILLEKRRRKTTTQFMCFPDNWSLRFSLTERWKWDF